MAVSALSSLSRVWPGCGRRVAPPAMSGRCGKSVEGVALTAPPPRAPLKPPPDSSRLEAAAKIGIVSVGVVMLGFMIYRSVPARTSVPTAAKSGSPAATRGGAPALSPAAAARAAQASGATDIVLPASDPAAPSDAPVPAPIADPPAAREATSDLPQPSAMPLESLIHHAMPGVVL